MNSHFKIFAVVAAMALLIPAGAVAKRPDDKSGKGHSHAKVEKGSHGKGKDKPKLSSVNVKGTVESNDGATMVVAVDKASGHAKGCKGESLSFDVSSARFHTADTDASGEADAADFAVGDEVKVRAKVVRTKGRKSECTLGAETIAAKAVHNRTSPEVDEDEATDEDEAVDEDESVEDEESLEVEDEVGDEDEVDEDEVLDEGEVDEGVEETDAV